MQTYSVSEITKRLQRLIAADAELDSGVAVEGEISNFKMHSSGHLYFSLKDSGAKMNCVMFYGNAQNLDFMPEDGMQVTAFGRVSVYEKTGVCQIYVSIMMKSGIGLLYEKYHQMKKQLEKQGYFALERKKTLPLFPRRIAVVTSPDGAAVHDILTVLGRRNPAAEIILCPTAVQGAGAAGEIAAAIDYVNARSLAEVIIVGRGGGSIEELWAFNELVVAEAIYDSVIPVISAVGHETDYTIADFVADARAATPSAAAEIACVLLAEVVADLQDVKNAMQRTLKMRVNSARAYLTQARQSRAMQLLPEAVRLRGCLSDYQARMARSVQAAVTDRRYALENLAVRLKSSDVNVTLNKGYAIVYKGDKPVRTPGELAAGDGVAIRFAHFTAEAEVTAVKEEKR